MAKNIIQTYCKIWTIPVNGWACPLKLLDIGTSLDPRLELTQLVYKIISTRFSLQTFRKESSHLEVAGSESDDGSLVQLVRDGGR